MREPLAFRLRPEKIDDILGQKDLVEQEIVIENSKPKKKDISSASIDVLRLWLKTGDKNKWKK